MCVFVALFLFFRTMKRAAPVKSFNVGIKAPASCAALNLSEDDVRTLRVQYDQQYYMFLDHSDLLSVLLKAREQVPITESTVVQKLMVWATDREKVGPTPLLCATLAPEEIRYLQSVDPSWKSLSFRSSADLAMLLQHLIKTGTLVEEADDGFCIKGELSRINHMKSSARNKCRPSKK